MTRWSVGPMRDVDPGFRRDDELEKIVIPAKAGIHVAHRWLLLPSTVAATMLLFLLGTPLRAIAQPVVKDAPASADRTTRSGVYTAAQATRGAEVYAGMCKSCHTPASHTGVTFAKWWKGHPLSDLYGYVSTRMPKNDPGGLDPAQYADVVAYLLRMNAMPPGDIELPADASALTTTRIEVARPVVKRVVVPRSKPKPGAAQ